MAVFQVNCGGNNIFMMSLIRLRGNRYRIDFSMREQFSQQVVHHIASVKIINGITVGGSTFGVVKIRLRKRVRENSIRE